MSLEAWRFGSDAVMVTGKANGILWWPDGIESLTCLPGGTCAHVLGMVGSITEILMVMRERMKELFVPIKVCCD